MDKILKKYDEYIFRFYKSPKVKAAFEERYFSAIRGGLDMAQFLAAEVAAIQELLNKAEEKISQSTLPQPSQKKEGFADKVLRQLQEKIEK